MNMMAVDNIDLDGKIEKTTMTFGVGDPDERGDRILTPLLFKTKLMKIAKT